MPIGGATSSAQLFPSAASAFWRDGEVVAGSAIFLMTTGSSTDFQGNYSQEPAAINDHVRHKFLLASGNYTLGFAGTKANGRGIASLYLNDVLVDTIDLYNSTAVRFAPTYDVTIQNDGLQVVDVVMASKNPASNNYSFLCSRIWLGWRA